MSRRLVLFDLDNTLVDRRGTVADWSAEFTARHGLDGEERAYVLGMVAERAYPSTFDMIRTRTGCPRRQRSCGARTAWCLPRSVSSSHTPRLLPTLGVGR